MSTVAVTIAEAQAAVANRIAATANEAATNKRRIARRLNCHRFSIPAL